MTNKIKIKNVANSLDLKIGCYDNKLDLLSKTQLKKVTDNIEFQSDTDVTINRKKYVVEIDIIDNEVDFSVLTKAEYIDRYGNERYEN